MKNYGEDFRSFKKRFAPRFFDLPSVRSAPTPKKNLSICSRVFRKPCPDFNSTDYPG